MWAKQKGFTIVELLIVIVVIAILAAISVVAFNGTQTRSRNAKIESDLAMMMKSINAARLASGEVATRYVTLSTATAGACVNTADQYDISKVNSDTQLCWSAYNSFLTKVSEAGGIDIRGMVDPWGRPYFLDENEKEGTPTCGTGRDNIGVYKIPRVSGNWSVDFMKQIPYITPGC